MIEWFQCVYERLHLLNHMKSRLQSNRGVWTRACGHRIGLVCVLRLRRYTPHAVDNNSTRLERSCINTTDRVRDIYVSDWTRIWLAGATGSGDSFMNRLLSHVFYYHARARAHRFKSTNIMPFSSQRSHGLDVCSTLTAALCFSSSCDWSISPMASDNIIHWNFIN